MADLYSYISGATPDQQDILEAELLAKQILEAEFPDLDLREGTGIRDTTIRPAAFMLALCKKACDTYFAENTLANATDTTSTEAVDDLMSNWFLERHTGTNAVISARLFFARQKNVTLPASTSFSTDGSLLFYPASTYVIPAASMQYDADSNEWYVDVDLKADSVGVAYNLAEGSLLYFSNFDSYFLHGEINYLVTESSNEETNTEFISRAKDSISTRNLINVPSVASNLQSSFNYLPLISTIGGGDDYMIRDMEKVVFTQETPRLATSISWLASEVTVVLAAHGFNTGQYILVAGAVPNNYNGAFSITVINDNSFTYSLASNPGTASVVPTIQSSTRPVYAHMGGKVDVYCSTTYEDVPTQLTLDSLGGATVTGPVFSISRSSSSAGTSADTVAVSTPISLVSTTYVPASDSITLVCMHGLTGTPKLKLSGITQIRTITSISCSERTIVATIPSHGMATGDSVYISGVSPVEYNGTYTAGVTVLNSNQISLTAKVDIHSAGSGTSMLASNPSLSGLFTATVVDASTLSVSVPDLWVGDPTGTLAVDYPTPFTVTNLNTATATATSLSCVGNVVTMILPDRCVGVSRFITVSGCAVSGYNGTWMVDSITSGNVLTFSVDSLNLASATSATVTFVNPSQDVGFSDRQTLRIDFGASQANKTASFDLRTFKYLDSVQSYLDDANNRVLCGDYLARGFNLYVLDVSLITYTSTAASTATCADLVETYLASLAPGEAFIMSEMVAGLTSGGISNLQLPVGVSFTYYTRDLLTSVSGTIADYLDPGDKTAVFVLGNISCSAASI